MNERGPEPPTQIESVCKDPARRAGERKGRTYPYLMREHPEPRPTDHTDAAQEIAPDLADIARGSSPPLKVKPKPGL